MKLARCKARTGAARAPAPFAPPPRPLARSGASALLFTRVIHTSAVTGRGGRATGHGRPEVPANRSRRRGSSMLTCLATLVAAALVSHPTVARTGDSGWTQDFAAAKATAAREHKDLLVDFTGTDWCAVCITLDKEVFSTAEFKAAAPKDF